MSKQNNNSNGEKNMISDIELDKSFRSACMQVEISGLSKLFDFYEKKEMTTDKLKIARALWVEFEASNESKLSLFINNLITKLFCNGVVGGKYV